MSSWSAHYGHRYEATTQGVLTKPGLCHCMSYSHLDIPVGAPRHLVSTSSSGGAREEANGVVRLSGRCRASLARAEALALCRWRRSSREQGRRPGLQVRCLPGRCVRGLQTSSGHDFTAALSCSSAGYDELYKHRGHTEEANMAGYAICGEPAFQAASAAPG